MKKLNIKNIHEWPLAVKSIIIIMACMFVFYFAYFWDFVIIKRQLVLNQQQENDLKTQLDATLHKYAELESEVSQLGNLEKSLLTWQNKLIPLKDLPELLNQILKIGRVSGLQFNLFNPGTEIKAEGYLKVPIKVVATGDYNQVANFISKVANMPWIVAIGDFSIFKEPAAANTTAKTNSNLLTAQIILEVYHLADK